MAFWLPLVAVFVFCMVGLYAPWSADWTRDVISLSLSYKARAVQLEPMSLEVPGRFALTLKGGFRPMAMTVGVGARRQDETSRVPGVLSKDGFYANPANVLFSIILLLRDSF